MGGSPILSDIFPIFYEFIPSLFRSILSHWTRNSQWIFIASVTNTWTLSNWLATLSYTYKFNPTSVKNNTVQVPPSKITKAWQIRWSWITKFVELPWSGDNMTIWYGTLQWFFTHPCQSIETGDDVPKHSRIQPLKISRSMEKACIYTPGDNGF